MQSYDHEQNLQMSKMFDSHKEAAEAAKSEMEKPEIAFTIVGKFPKNGQEVIVNGLKCQVIMANRKKRRFAVKVL